MTVNRFRQSRKLLEDLFNIFFDGITETRFVHHARVISGGQVKDCTLVRYDRDLVPVIVNYFKKNNGFHGFWQQRFAEQRQW